MGMQTNISSKLQHKHPLPMQYLGSKLRISKWILDEIEANFGKKQRFIDLMSGTGAVAYEAALRGYQIIANDIQPYSYIVLKSVFQDSKAGIPQLINNLMEYMDNEAVLLKGRQHATNDLKEELWFQEELIKGHIDWRRYHAFCERTAKDPGSSTKRFDLFSTYYPSTYFGVRQCLELDAIQEFASILPDDLKTHLIASAVSSMTFLVSSTTHLAQFLKPSSDTTASHLLRRRSLSILDETIKRLRALADYPTPIESVVFNTDYREVLRTTDKNHGVVYADPPYFKEHYSRYYHVLDTFALYDFPELSFNRRINAVTVGRYRENRIVSDFGLKSKVSGAFDELFALSAEKDLDVALSYASTSLLSADHIVGLANKYNYDAKIETKALLHSGQGQAMRNKKVTEYLFLFKYGR
jgi:adenine-specific DNA-methyltransferase